MRPAGRRLHRWLALASSTFLAIWLGSGLVLLAPSPDREIAPPPRPLDLGEIRVAADRAVAAVAADPGRAPAVRTVTLRRLADLVVYEIVTTAGETRLVDARSGEGLEISAEVAARIARAAAPAGSRVLAVERVARHSVAYPWGPVPVYRVVLDTDAGVRYDVAERDGRVTRATRLGWLRNAIVSLHTFDPVKLASREPWLRKGLLLLALVLVLAALGTGLRLALSRGV
jgi:hypothetical protein